MPQRTIDVTGMTCTACEQTVVAAATSLPGVAKARASARAGTVVVTGTSLPPDAALARALKGTPYGVGSTPAVSREWRVWRDVAIAVVAVAAATTVAGALGLTERTDGAVARAGAGSLAFVLLLGVAASVSTCMALVGGLVASLSASVPPGGSRVRPHVAFNAGRIVGFAMFGAVVGAVGQAVALSGTALAVTMIAAALVMGLLGVRLTGLFPRVSGWSLHLPARFASLAAVPRDGRTLLLGAATFFVPCGFTQAVQVLALSSGSAASGAAIMAAFALGTTPGLFAIGVGASALTKPRFAPLLRGMGVVVLAFAMITGVGALRALAPAWGPATIEASTRTANVIDVGGVQEATTRVVTAGYEPANTVVYAGVPVRWTLDPLVVSCAGIVDGDAVGVGRIEALYEDAVAEFTIDEPGTYTFNCAMGMYSGTITAIEAPQG